MGRQSTFGRFVRLNINGEIVEVLGCDSSDITINFKGNILTMDHDEVSRITSEEAAVAAEKHLDGLDLR
jgi:hypothetical protein